jgi:hypothetical protein
MVRKTNAGGNNQVLVIPGLIEAAGLPAPGQPLVFFQSATD